MTKLTKFQEEAQRKCLEWLWGKDCTTTQLDGEPFVIVPGWDVVETPSFDKIIATAAGEKSEWGFSDEYDTCGECGDGIRTSADSYHWQPDYWLSDYAITCKFCVVNDYQDDYIEHRRDHSQGVRQINTDLLHPDDAGYTVIIEGCEHGLHEHQNDDPRTIAEWAEENNLWVLFTIGTGQFDVTWDAYMKHDDDRELTKAEIEEIRKSLVENSHESSHGNRDYLKKEFKQWPTPADLCKTQLIQVSEMGANFASVGGEDGLVVYENFEEMQEALRKN